MVKAIFDGFDTIEQAKAFLDWYSFSGENDSDIFLSEWTNLDSAYINVHNPYTYTEDSVTCTLKLFYKKNEKNEYL